MTGSSPPRPRPESRTSRLPSARPLRTLAAGAAAMAAGSGFGTALVGASASAGDALRRVADPAGAARRLSEHARTVRRVSLAAGQGAQAQTRRVGSGLATATSPTTLRGVVIESAWVGVHLALWPFGFAAEQALSHVDGPDAPYSLADLPPQRRSAITDEVAGGSMPILLLHGLVDNRSIFTMLRRALRRDGFSRVLAMNYSLLTSDVRTAAAELGERIEAFCVATGTEQIHVVGHSLGGIIARYYVQRLGGHARVHTLVTLGSPHRGTQLARLLPVRLCRQLRPGSDVLAELAEPAPGCTTRMLAVYGQIDQLVVPARSARIDHPDLVVRNVMVAGVGHMSLPVDPRVARMVADELQRSAAEAG